MAVTDSPRDCRARAMARTSLFTATGRPARRPVGLGGAQPVESALADQVAFSAAMIDLSGSGIGRDFDMRLF